MLTGSTAQISTESQAVGAYPTGSAINHSTADRLEDPSFNANNSEESNLMAKNSLPSEFNMMWKKTEQYYLQELKENKIIGSSTMFLYSGEVVAHSYFGFADLETKRKVDERTIYHWASITKTFTSIAIMQLRDRGLLKLSDPVVDYIPELKEVHNPYGSMKDITLKHLMSHTSGFRASSWPWGGDQDWHPYEPLHWEQLTAMFPYTKILFRPGSQYSYSNPAVIFLGKIIEQISGDDYEVYIDKNILKPLGMYHTYFDGTPYHLLKQRSNSYFIRNNEITANGLDFDTGITVSNGGLNAPLPDMAKYLSWLTDDSAPDSQILSRNSLKEMWSPQIVIEDNTNLKRSMGLSFFIYDRPGLTLMGHTGEQKGYISFIKFHPASRTAAIAVFNTTDIVKEGLSNTRQFSSKLQNILSENIWPLFADDK